MVLDFIRNKKYCMIVRTSYTTPASYVKLSIGTPKPGKCNLINNACKINVASL